MIIRLNKTRRLFGFSANSAGAIPCCCFCCLGPTTTGSTRIRINSSSRAGPLPAFTQFRGLRGESTQQQQHQQQKRSPANVAASADALKLAQIRHNFKRAYAKLIVRIVLAVVSDRIPGKYRRLFSSHPPSQPHLRQSREGGSDYLAQLVEDIERQIKQCVDEFNMRTPEYMVVPPADVLNYVFFTFFCMPLLLLFAMPLMYILYIDNFFMDKGHAQLLDGPAGIRMDEFVRDYLGTSRKVKSVHFYYKKDAIAELEPDAIIINKGQPFDGPGVRIELDNQLRRDPKGFRAWLETEQKQNQIDGDSTTMLDYIPVIKHPSGYLYLALFIYPVSVYILGCKFWLSSTRSFFFKIVRRKKPTAIKSSK